MGCDLATACCGRFAFTSTPWPSAIRIQVCTLGSNDPCLVCFPEGVSLAGRSGLYSRFSQLNRVAVVRVIRPGADRAASRHARDRLTPGKQTEIWLDGAGTARPTMRSESRLPY